MKGTHGTQLSSMVSCTCLQKLVQCAEYAQERGFYRGSYRVVLHSSPVTHLRDYFGTQKYRQTYKRNRGPTVPGHNIHTIVQVK